MFAAIARSFSDSFSFTPETAGGISTPSEAAAVAKARLRGDSSRRDVRLRRPPESADASISSDAPSARLPAACMWRSVPRSSAARSRAFIASDEKTIPQNESNAGQSSPERMRSSVLRPVTEQPSSGMIQQLEGTAKSPVSGERSSVPVKSAIPPDSSAQSRASLPAARFGSSRTVPAASFCRIRGSGTISLTIPRPRPSRNASTSDAAIAGPSPSVFGRSPDRATRRTRVPGIPPATSPIVAPRNPPSTPKRTSPPAARKRKSRPPVCASPSRAATYTLTSPSRTHQTVSGSSRKNGVFPVISSSVPSAASSSKRAIIGVSPVPVQFSMRPA